LNRKKQPGLEVTTSSFKPGCFLFLAAQVAASVFCGTAADPARDDPSCQVSDWSAGKPFVSVEWNYFKVPDFFQILHFCNICGTIWNNGVNQVPLGELLLAPESTRLCNE